MKSLKLFNAVLAKQSNCSPIITENGFIITPEATWAKEQIVDYLLQESLNGNDLNKTFHKSWNKILTSSRFELLVEQIRHYISTYGSDFQDEVYIPNEILDLEGVTLKYKVIKAYTKEQFIQKSLDVLKSGVALKQETVDLLLDFLISDLEYTFNGDEKVKNKEAFVKLVDYYGIVPKNSVEVLRYVVYRCTDSTLLIKSPDVLNKIKTSSFNPDALFKKVGLEEMSKIFNRFKPIFLEFKNRCPRTINKISKLSKKYHTPLKENSLNQATSIYITDGDLQNASVFFLFRVLQAIKSRLNKQDTYLYKIRNGKTWLDEQPKEVNSEVLISNFNKIVNHLKSKFNFSDRVFYIEQSVQLGLPTSEKQFIGNIPFGTKFKNDKLVVGIYWRDEWGARDLDLSAINLVGKVGWNSSYNQDGNLLYSGDITSAKEGAVEYLYNSNNSNRSIVKMNVYDGLEEAVKYKVIIGKGDDVKRNIMLEPSNVLAEFEVKTVSRENILGVLDNNTFTVFSLSSGNNRVSTSSRSMSQVEALHQQYNNQVTLNDIILELGGKIVNDINNKSITDNLSIDNLEKDTLIKLFQ